MTAVLPLPRAPGGARRQRRFTFVGNKKEAEKALIAELAAIGNGTFVAPDRTTFGQYLADWLVSSRSTFAGKTWERFEGIARVHAIPRLGDVALQRLTAIHLTKSYAEWREGGLSGQTVIHHHRLIHRVLAQALREGRVRQNVAAIGDKPKVARREMRFLSTDEIARVFDAVEDTRFSPLIAIALATGARRGESLGLKWDDVDLTRGTVAVRRSLEQTKRGVAEKTPKSGKSRVIALTAGAIETLRRHRIAEADAFGIGRTSGSSEHAARSRRSSEGRSGNARLQLREHHDGSLQPRDADAADRSRCALRCCLAPTGGRRLDGCILDISSDRRVN